jgi:superfamily II DNA or RNA helicase
MTVNAVEVRFPDAIEPKPDPFGMRPMQRRAFDKRDAKYLLIKSPPASGKSWALMYVALDKLRNQGIKKVIVAVPEVSIGASFKSTLLSNYGFYADWEIKPEWDLCSIGTEDGLVAKSKVSALKSFLESSDQILVCTHATLRFSFQDIGAKAFTDCLVAIDEFHHSSSDEENKLGTLIRDLIDDGGCHIIAMTGSYFRGDDIAVMRPDDEAKFTSMSYTYYEQMAAYKHLKKLLISYHFYQGEYLNAIHEVLDTYKKTIIHIPHIMSAESTKLKHDEVDRIIESIGELDMIDEVTGFWKVRTVDGRLLNVVNLVDDNPKIRQRCMASLRTPELQADVDIIIALGMAKEGFDWPPAEHAITIAYRSSLTEQIQIIGRVTRDYPGKSVSRFTNLVAEPKADDSVVVGAVNGMLKAVAVSLAMEQALTPKFNFYRKKDNNGHSDVSFNEDSGVISIGIKGIREPTTERAKEILENEMHELVAAACQDINLVKASMSDSTPGEVVNEVYLAKIIEKKFPDLNIEEHEVIREHLSAHMVMSSIAGKPIDDFSSDDEFHGSNNFVSAVKKFVNVNDLHIDLIDSINPFAQAYEVLSKGLTSEVLKTVHNVVKAQSIQMSEAEALALWPRIQRFAKDNLRDPDSESSDELEKRLGKALIWLRNKKRERMQQGD